MTRARPYLAALLGCAALGAAAADDSGGTARGMEPYSEHESGLEVAVRGNSRGATGCQACHGRDGRGNAELGYPRLAGLPEPYLRRQLQAFRAGTRASEPMERIASALSDREITLVAGYYAGLPVPDTTRDTGSAELRARGRNLAKYGRWPDKVPACIRCHGTQGHGVPPRFPPLSGQHASYLEGQLRAWREGRRTNDPIGLMGAVAERLTDTDIEALAVYFASVTPGTPRAAALQRDNAPNPGAPRPGDGEGWLAELLPGVGDDDAARQHLTEMPDGKFGEAVERGRRIFVFTQEHAAEHAGNRLNCTNCHLDQGRRPESAAMGAAYVKYPKYRGKNEKVNTIQHRIQGCFRYSLNGDPPEANGPLMTDLVSYFHWLSRTLPSGVAPPEAGFAQVDDPPEEPSVQRGAQVFARACAICHGANGEGTQVDGVYQFPAVWGNASYNWGAGMHRVPTAAKFIYHNMPFGRPGHLSVQEAWDVASYINSQPRPQDPRFEGDVAATRKQYHQHDCWYGDTQGGRLLGRKR